jgi:hypothetical protein
MTKGVQIMTAIQLSIGSFAAALLLASTPVGATILTFDVAGGVTNFQNVPQDYGDNVAASPQAGHSYGVGAEGFTPNVVVDYGSPDEDPALWTTGYGDLTNVHFNDADGDTSFTIGFIADTGFEVQLFDLDIASFAGGGRTIQGLLVRDGDGNTLHSQGSTFITGATHLAIDLAGPLQASALELVIDLTGLGTFSDDIGVDNIRFGQVAVQPPPAAVSEPASFAILAIGLLGVGLRRRKSRS